MTTNSALSATQAIRIYETMVRIRTFDERIQRRLAAGEMQFQYYPTWGQEAIPATISVLLNRDDKIVTTYRGLHDSIAKGASMRELMAELAGKSNGLCKGKGGPMHIADPANGVMMTSGIVGGGLPIANGIALAEQLKGSDRVVVCNFGDGATNIGTFGEALNLAALWSLPVIFVCQNNCYAEYTSLEESTRSTSLAKRADPYGMQSFKTNGTDPHALYEAFSAAVSTARCGRGPTMVECVALRLQGHAFGSEEIHMNKGRLTQARQSPPLEAFRARLVNDKVLTDGQATEIEKSALVEVEEAVKFSDSGTALSQTVLYEDVFCDLKALPYNDTKQEMSAVATSSATEPARKLNISQALREALDLALGNDPSVIVMGEDIEDPTGGVAKVTAGLSTKYGRERVRSTPISEAAIVGAAIGASFNGFKPVAEIMICDFALVCMDQIANHAAKLRYMSGGRTPVPITIRMMTSGKVGAFGAQHSQSLEALFAHIPGLKVAMPSNAADAKGLLLACIDDPDPCIIIEPLRQYFAETLVPEGPYKIPLGSARIVRAGTDLTLISYGWMVQEAMRAAAQLEKDGISTEVIDLRTLVPVDMPMVLRSIYKTRRAMVAHAAVEFCGYGAELVAHIQKEMFGNLLKPVTRIGAKYTPVPFTGDLEDAHFPSASSIVSRAKGLF